MGKLQAGLKDGVTMVESAKKPAKTTTINNREGIPNKDPSQSATKAGVKHRIC